MELMKRQIKWDIGWFGPPPTDSEEHSIKRRRFFVDCMWCDRSYARNLRRCKTKQDLVELYRSYIPRIDLSEMEFSVGEADIEAIAETTWRDARFQAGLRGRNRANIKQGTILQSYGN